MCAQRLKIGVMGSAGESLNEADIEHVKSLAKELGTAIANSNCILVTGETSGVPGAVIDAVHSLGGYTVGISPAHSKAEHLERYQMPPTSSEVVIYTGFGLKGRNVVNIRSSDIVMIVCGSIGTLNEFTIAYDEGKVIGVLQGSRGVAEELSTLVKKLGKKTSATIVYDDNPDTLLQRCIEVFTETAE